MKIRFKKYGEKTSRIVIKHKMSGQVLHDESESNPIPCEVDSGSVAIIKTNSAVTLSLEYHSVMVSAGIEMPMSVQPDDLKGAKRAKIRVQKMEDEYFEKRASKARNLLRELTRG